MTYSVSCTGHYPMQEGAHAMGGRWKVNVANIAKGKEQSSMTGTFEVKGDCG